MKENLLKDRIFKIKTREEFKKLALEIFRHQSEENPIYARYVSLRKTTPSSVKSIAEIPFLPISFFKVHEVLCSKKKPKETFVSSGTGTGQTSKHFVADLLLYEKSFTTAIEMFFGKPQNFRILALLPGYLERNGSSLVYMMNRLMELSGHSENGFYLQNHEELAKILQKNSDRKTLLLGVSFALLNFLENRKFRLKNTLVMETGGMKGRQKEITREELHNRLKDGFGVETVYSEYGMTELLSQAYSKENNLFYTPPWMKIMIRDIYDPFSYMEKGRTGGINIIDLANIHSCSFIETQDLGRMHPCGGFEVLGRFDQSDIRGCNLLV